eukprot:TRINITY_DN3238_c0_g1_i15.p1 TRINITY_DN3238_c0_g1~~TRINITY_DN3238_c0_g1_i15.p1  ORF type:complete len:1754 (+),score=356.05 TRINITY_DN3238_c0_g1_i15:102-5363(+)
MIRRPPRSTLSSSSAASDVYKRQVHGVLEYCIDLFERESMQWFVRHLQTLLESISMAADVPISELNVIPDAERDVLLEQWSGVQRYKQDAQRFPSGCVHELIGQQVQRTPGNRALSSVGESELTYSELWALSSDVGCVLRSKGVAEGCIVALMVDRSVHMVVAMIGIHAAGAAYAPFAPKMPQERLSFMAEDCRTVVVLTTEKHYELGRSIGVSTVLRMGTDDMVAVGAPGEGVPSMSQQLTALCLYTSGSTGKPKAVLLSHAAVVSHLDYIVTEYGYTEDDKYLQSISYTFVASLPELFGVLLVGGSVLLSAADSLLFLDNMAKYIRDEGITLAQFIPSVMSSFIETETLAESVRCLVLTGEPLPVSLLEKVMEMSPRLRILNHYGCTEVTDTTTVKVFSGELSKAYKNVPVGKPVKHRTVMILDSQRRPVPLGAPGELWVGGVGCATAYLNQPKLTEEKFVRGLCGFERLYATGDLVRWRPDGDMECLGRIDLQVKINGLRIELGEIEGVLMSDPDVQEAVVLLQDKLLVAYASPATEDGGKKLLEHCRASLPGYMVPVAVIGMDDWPRNANGKLDRRALPRFSVPKQVPNSSEMPSGDPESAETLVMQVMAGVLQVAVTSTEDNIFLLGGTSLSVARITSELRRTSPGLTLRDVYSNPDVGGMANMIREDFEAQRETSGGLRTSGGTNKAMGRAIRWRHMVTGLGSVTFAVMIIMDAVMSIMAYMIPWIWVLYAADRSNPDDRPLRGRNKFEITSSLHPDWNTVQILAGFILLLTYLPGLWFVLSHILAKWIFVCRYQQGVHPVYGPYYMRWWLIDRMQKKARYGHYWLSGLARTPMLVGYLRLLGAHIGKNVFIDGMVIGDYVSMTEPDLVFLGDNVTLNNQANIMTHFIKDGFLTLKGVTLGSQSQVGCRALVMPGSVLGRNVVLCEHSVLQEDQTAPNDTIWKGSPAMVSDESYYEPYLHSLGLDDDAANQFAESVNFQSWLQNQHVENPLPPALTTPMPFKGPERIASEPLPEIPDTPAPEARAERIASEPLPDTPVPITPLPDSPYRPVRAATPPKGLQRTSSAPSAPDTAPRPDSGKSPITLPNTSKRQRRSSMPTVELRPSGSSPSLMPALSSRLMRRRRASLPTPNAEPALTAMRSAFPGSYTPERSLAASASVNLMRGRKDPCPSLAAAFSSPMMSPAVSMSSPALRRRARRRRSSQHAPISQAELAHLNGFNPSCFQSLIYVLMYLIVVPCLRASIQVPSLAVYVLVLQANDWNWAISPEDIVNQFGFEGAYLLPLSYFVWFSSVILLVPMYKAMLMPKGMQAGLYPLGSWKVLHIWLVSQLQVMTEPLMDFLYGTMITSWWIVLLGGNAPNTAEVAAHLNVTSFVPELVDFKENSVVASHVDVGTMVVNKGQLITSKVTLGEKSMLGNHVWVSPGTTLGKDALVGAYTVNASTDVPEGTTWFGSPAIELPKRFVAGEETLAAFSPSFFQKCGRAASEFLQALIDASLVTLIKFAYIGIAAAVLVQYFHPAYWFPLVLFVAPGQWLLCMIIHQLAHWTCVCGAGKPRFLPLWSWRLNLIMMFKRIEDLLMRDIVWQFSGTPYMASVLRMLGAKIGSHGFFHGCWACEWDMLNVGDNACITYTDMQTHLFEDRVFKSNPVRIGDHVSVMAFSLILPNTTVESGVEIGPKSCVMQGETIPGYTRWQGAPLSLVRKTETGLKRSKWSLVKSGFKVLGALRNLSGMSTPSTADSNPTMNRSDAH